MEADSLSGGGGGGSAAGLTLDRADRKALQMQRNGCIYKEYNANARLQMKYIK